MATVPTTFLKQHQLNPQHIVFKSWDSKGNCVDYTRAELRQKMAGFAQRLYALGVCQDSKVGVLGEAAVDLSSVIMAIWALGGTVVHIPLSARKDLGDSKEAFVAMLTNHELSFIIVSRDQDFLNLEQILEETFEPIQLFSLEGKSQDVFPLFTAEVEEGFLERVVFLNAEKAEALNFWKESKRALMHNEIVELQLVQNERKFVHGDCVWVSSDIEDALGFELFIDAFTGNHTLCFSGLDALDQKMNMSIVLMSSQEISRMLYAYFRGHKGGALLVLKWAFAVAIQSEQPTLKSSRRIHLQKQLLRRFFDHIRARIFNDIQCVGMLNKSDADNTLFIQGIGVSVVSISRNTFDIKS